MFDVEVVNAGLTYNNQQIFAGVNLTLKGGRWTYLLGGSGVGKTSLLRFIAGLDNGPKACTTGFVHCEDNRPLKNRIAWMAQQDLLLPWYSVLDNVMLGEKLRSSFFNKKSSMSVTRDKALAMLERVGLENKAGAFPENLSGGQKQRVALARTLMENRPLVLMDEPFGALDAITRFNLQDMACELLSKKTVMLITHDPLEALRLGHQVYSLQGLPATVSDVIEPIGDVPRSLENPHIIRLQSQLLDRLRREQRLSRCE